MSIDQTRSIQSNFLIYSSAHKKHYYSSFLWIEFKNNRFSANSETITQLIRIAEAEGASDHREIEISDVVNELARFHIELGDAPSGNPAYKKIEDIQVVVTRSPPEWMDLVTILSDAAFVSVTFNEILSGIGKLSLILGFSATGIMVMGAARDVASGLQEGLYERISKRIAGDAENPTTDKPQGLIAAEEGKNLIAVEEGRNISFDLVFCIDCTSSMQPLLNSAKEFSNNFYSAMAQHFENSNVSLNAFRVKIIGFRDFFVDGDDSFFASKFFDLPEESAGLKRVFDSLQAFGGGDEPESSLEALAEAIDSDWSEGTGRRRHVICLITDASGHPFEKASTNPPPGYPQNMPKTLDELMVRWETTMDSKSKRMVIMAPETYPWSTLVPEQGGIENAIHYPSKAGAGLSDSDFSQIVTLVASSI